MEPHTAPLSFWAPLAMSVLSLLRGGLKMVLWRRAREVHLLMSAFSWWGLCVYFALLAISAGGSPIFTRGSIAVNIRLWLAATALMIAASTILLVCKLLSNGREQEKESSEKLMVDEKRK